MITRTIMQYRTWGDRKVRVFGADEHLSPQQAVARIVRAEHLVSVVMVDVVTIQYVYAPQHEWAKEPA